MSIEAPKNPINAAQNISEARSFALADAMGGTMARFVPYIPVIVIGWGLFMGVVVDLSDYREAVADRIHDSLDNTCGLCGHTCALTIPALNYCGCWVTLAMGGGCSCLLCSH